jgi:RNA polymerase sigma factor (sigma-70 family)
VCSIAENGGVDGGDFACAQRGCRVCQDVLVREHSGLIHSVLRRVEHAGVPYAELVQEGRLALWHAVLGFDPDRGVRFATYGWRVVEHALWAAVRRARQDGAGALPAGAGSEAWRVLSQQPAVQAALRVAVAQLPERLRDVVTLLYGLEGHEPCTQAALGRAWGISRERIRQLHVQALVRLRHPGLGAQVYQVCEQDSRAAYHQALQRNRAWQRRQRP